MSDKPRLASPHGSEIPERGEYPPRNGNCEPAADRTRQTMTADERKLILATPQPDCPACQKQSIHSEEDWRFHPFKTHGYAGSGWTHPAITPKPALVKASI